jgi:hypothetical protein
MLMAMRLISKVFFFSTIATLFLAKGLDETFLSLINASSNGSNSSSCLHQTDFSSNSTETEIEHESRDESEVLAEIADFTEKQADQAADQSDKATVACPMKELFAKQYPTCARQVQAVQAAGIMSNYSTLGVI